MTAFDYILLGIVAVSCLIGIWRGLLKEAVSLVTWVAAIFIAGFYSSRLALYLTFFDNLLVRQVIAFSLVFIVIMFAGAWIGSFFSKLGSAAGLGKTDRILGAIFGLLRGIIIILIGFLLSIPLAPDQNWHEGSVLAPWLLSLVEYFHVFTGLDEFV